MWWAAVERKETDRFGTFFGGRAKRACGGLHVAIR